MDLTSFCSVRTVVTKGIIRLVSNDFCNHMEASLTDTGFIIDLINSI